ncbi:MAG: hypothetical protein Q8S16_05540 [Polaromonas sp.]|nr:hypothetical protein [Polaromonas sp.]
MAQLVINAAVGSIGMRQKQLSQPAMTVRVFMRMLMDVIVTSVDMRLLALQRAARAMHHTMHQTQQGREQQHKGQKAPGRVPCHAPERHGFYFTVTASLMR